jgi:hypothetical protein
MDGRDDGWKVIMGLCLLCKGTVSTSLRPRTPALNSVDCCLHRVSYEVMMDMMERLMDGRMDG